MVLLDPSRADVLVAHNGLGFYAAHQIAQWALIYHAQVRVRKYTRGLHPVNVAALGMNAGFIALHFVQTHIWYDGLAQDVSIWSALGRWPSS